MRKRGHGGEMSTEFKLGAQQYYIDSPVKFGGARVIQFT